MEGLTLQSPVPGALARVEGNLGCVWGGEVWNGTPLGGWPAAGAKDDV